MPATAATVRKGAIHRATAPAAENITPGKLMLQSIERQSPTAGDGAIGAWHGSGVVVLGFRNLTHYRVTHCSAAAHSTPGQHVVDQRCRVDDQVDGVGQPLPGPADQLNNPWVLPKEVRKFV
jgi:hypothetical protein